MLSFCTLYFGSTRGEPEAAEVLFLKALESDPQYLDALNSLASLKQKQGDSAAAEKYYRRGLALEELSADLHNNYATFLMGKWWAENIE